MTNELRDEMLKSYQPLYAFAMSLTKDQTRAEDLVQGTYLSAVEHIDSFTPGTKMQAWLFTILRNKFRSDYRKYRREVEDAEGTYAATLITAPDQIYALTLKDFSEAFKKLPREQRAALMLVGVQGCNYTEAAESCDVAIGTIKSRVHRAREKLSTLIPDRDRVLSAVTRGGVVASK
jgi:RNA polymerase sigma-70 factor, ECF subfamily